MQYSEHLYISILFPLHPSVLHPPLSSHSPFCYTPGCSSRRHQCSVTLLGLSTYHPLASTYPFPSSILTSILVLFGWHLTLWVSALLSFCLHHFFTTYFSSSGKFPNCSVSQVSHPGTYRNVRLLLLDCALLEVKDSRSAIHYRFSHTLQSSYHTESAGKHWFSKC